MQENTNIPVLGHADGICHVYIDSSASILPLHQIIDVVIDSKTQYPAACNACETLLVHKDVVASCLPAVVKALMQKNVKLKGCQRVIDFFSSLSLIESGDSSAAVGGETTPVNPVIELVSELEWATEYSDLVLAVKVVDTLNEAISHINAWGSHHTGLVCNNLSSNLFTDSILAADAGAAQTFCQQVDSCCVFHNCSTRFADGFRFGFGAEVNSMIF